MGNILDIILFENEVKTRLIGTAMQYMKLSKLKMKEKNLKDRQMITVCQRQIVEKIQAQDRMIDFQDLLVKFSGYKLKH